MKKKYYIIGSITLVLIVTVIIIFLFILILSYLIASRVTYPITLLTSAIKEVGEGNYDIAEEMRKLAFEDIDLAILKVIDYTINKLVSSGRMLHNETINARNYLISKGVK